MKMSMSGDAELIAQMRYLAEKVPDASRKVMHRQSAKIVELAKRMAPWDDGELEDSIRMEKGYETNGRLKINIIAGGTVRGVDVDRYVMLIHENYESMTPGPGTAVKRALNPDVYIGSKFIERAVDQSLPKLNKAMIEVVMNEMRILEK